MDTDAVRDYFIGLQERIVAALEALDGTPFRRDEWTARRGRRRHHALIEDGKLFERGGVNFSHVTGDELPPSATAARPSSPGAAFEAMGVSLVLHPRNPYVPDGAHERALLRRHKAGAEPVWWFGGGMDLTPYYGFDEDCVHFHRTCRDALAPFGAGPAPALQEVVRRVFLPQAPQRAARHRRHFLRRLQRAAASSTASR